MREVEVPEWLKRLPLAPEFRPTDSEFSDPIAYISKIEKEAGAFGICKVIPPLPKPSKKYVLHNLNKSLYKCPDLVSEVNLVSSSGGGESKGLFTTRQQELGQSEKRVKGRVVSQTIGTQKQVWQSGEVYTLEQFEFKSKNFAKGKLGGVKDVSPTVIEAMFWKSSTEKPVYVEYANDVPGSGFGELEGSSRYLHGRRRHRRKRGTFIRNNVDSNGSKNDQVSRSSSSVLCNNSLDNNPDVRNTEASFTCSRSSLSDLSEKHTGKKCSNTGNEMEGTSGWKLSNSPWNLQLIARSPGSLTRFMPDDIPGVTSPMIYIGMLFSWFAWHVEDHDLHSLNYLHVGSPKTWYAVPGDYASTFEEVIRLHAYGGNVGRLDALTLLGEKTTLLSPEVIVTSGIPCCRLVQNPGEFVVTFPRAYHLGFSHGFNCGEAANFGTPLWLKVAKEAAVRRAAMNYLPMLSHQQLLYLLTMSFVSRVPRSLLLGVRNSRLRNRQKEERELSVKKAFVEDLLKENCLLSTLLQKSSRRVVMWDLDRLPSSSKVSQLHNDYTISPLSKDANHSDNSSNQDLYTEMSLFMDNVSDLYADDADDLLCDYQVDSGTLPCVGCGILGFPFMAVVQPSEQAAQALLAEDPEVIQKLGAPKSVDELSSVISVMAEGFVDDARKSKEEILCNKSVASSSAVWGEFVHSPKHASLPSPVKPEEWKPLDWCLRPRIFCLEHAIQTVDMLLARGGSKVLGICHSDFMKIIAHAAAVAEDIHIPFPYDEIPLEDASPEDLSLIDHAIGGEEKDECTKDWTARLHISMQHCAKMRKADPYHKVQHALNVGGLFSEELGCRNDFKWQSRRLRSKRKSHISSSGKSVENVQIRTVEEPHAVQDGETDGKRDRVILQCYRRKSKFGHSATKGIINKSTGSDKLFPECPLADCGDLCKNVNELLENTCVLAEDARISFPLRLAPSISTAILQDEDLVSENLSNNSALQAVELPTVTTSVAESNEIQTGYVAKNMLPEMNVISGSPSRDLQKLAEVEVSEESCCTPDIVNSDTSASLLDDSAYCNVNFEPPKENIVAGVIHRKNGAHNEVETDDCGAPCLILAEDASSPFDLCSDANDLSGERHDTNVENTNDEQGVCGSEILSSQENTELDSAVSPENTELNGAVSPENTELNGAEITVDEQGVSGSEIISSQENTELNGAVSPETQPKSTAVATRKRRREVDVQDEDQHGLSSFIRGPCEGLRPRSKTCAPGISSAREEEEEEEEEEPPLKNVTVSRKPKKEQHVSVPSKEKVKVQKKGCHKCNVDGCRMSFQTKAELAMHTRNCCPVEGCGKKFSSHKYARIHQRVHDDDRPLKCTWEGCKMTFKWAWARTEHLRVHTGERPYKCEVEGCGLTFRFVSDFSRHRRKTGHYAN